MLDLGVRGRGMIRVKICGITRQSDARAAAHAGANAIGCILWPRSPRGICLETAREIVASLPPFVDSVAVVVNPSDALLSGIASDRSFRYIQFHGDESAAQCAESPLPWLKAVRVRSGSDIAAAAEQFSGASALLLDSYKAGMRGGTGEVFDWSVIPRELPVPIVLSGGLSPQNVFIAVQNARPYAIDANSGVEISPGCKDPGKIEALIREVQRASDT